jgi:hypothetical protein
VSAFYERTIADLARSGLDEADARAMAIEDLSASDVQELTKGAFKATAYKLPYFDQNKHDIGFFRIRFHEPQIRANAFGDKGKKKAQRYWQPPRTGVNTYLAPMPGIDWDKILSNPELTIFITEGEKKAAAANKHKLYCLGLGGVYSLGSKRQEISLLPELIKAGVGGRKIRFVFDGDDQTNGAVDRAGRRGCQLMVEAGADVGVIHLPIHEPLDTFLKNHGPQALLDLPVVPFDVKAQIAVAREMPKVSVRIKREKIWSLMASDLKERVSFHTVANGETKDLYYFDRDTLRLYDVNNPKNRETRAALNAHYGTNGSEDEWYWLHDELANHIFRDGTPTVVHPFASVNKDKSTLYVYDGDQRVFKVTPSGWTREPNGTDGVLFRNPGMTPIELAEEGRRAAAEMLTETANFKDGRYLKADQARLLYDLWCWTPFFPELMPTRPILLLNGPQGSAKTSALRRYLQTLNGPAAEVFVLDPKRLDGLIAALSHDPVVVIDNADGAIKGLENIVAVAATGGKYPLRELFTTNDPRVVQLTAFVAATSRDPKPFRRPDVADRLLPLTVDRRETFLEEAQINTETNRNRPAWWWYALTVLPAMLKALRTYRPKRSAYRLADFTRFCLAVGPVIGYKRDVIEAALKAVDDERSEFASEGSTLPEALETACRTFKDNTISRAKQGKGKDKDKDGEDEEDREPWLTADQLLTAVQLCVPDFPYKNAQSFGTAVRNEQAALRIQGITVKTKRRHASKLNYHVSWKGETGSEKC